MPKDLDINDILNAENTEEVQVQHRATKPAGRPLKEGERATKRVVIYLTPSQLEEIEEHCFKSRVKVGTFVKETFFRVFHKEKKSTNQIDDFIENLDIQELGNLVKKFLKRED